MTWVSSKHLTCNCSYLTELTAQRYPPRLMAQLPDTLVTEYLVSFDMFFIVNESEHTHTRLHVLQGIELALECK